ncbi:PIG-L deacetylase family protein [Pendulispora albinea]|uniref:PIG-L family deacetylase n=1 Tax=Pendulispora albinea TaxID=2741071 RepID=A0ABZ2M3N9_9BACT
MNSVPHPCAMAALHAERPGRILLVAAHPDDETIGLGATLGSLIAAGWRAHVLHVTDGAPHDPKLRFALQHRSREEASAIRRVELENALRAGGVEPDGVLLPSMGIADQEASLAMPAIARALAEQITTLGANVVITHPYEGGHPDHDATALAVHGAAALLAAQKAAPTLAEMSSYHTREGSLITATFRTDAPLRGPAPPVRCTEARGGELDDGARARKRRMLDAFTTQVEILRPFGTDAEPLRCAPRYDFSRPPHAGPLHYESLPFDWTGARWRELARRAIAELGLV